MKWNWQKPDWPKFDHNQADLNELEAQFLYKSGILIGAYKHISEEDKITMIVNITSDEALKSSKIEGEILNRGKRTIFHPTKFWLGTSKKKIPPAEQGIAEMMVDSLSNI